jgi:pheromone a factor receptor
VAISMESDKRRAVYVDLAIGLSIPFVQMILRESTPDRFASPCLTVVLSEIVVEGHRFDIIEEFGCVPNYYNVTLAYPISLIWTPVLYAITLVYAGALGFSDLSPRAMSHHTLVLNIRLFWRSSLMFKGMLGSNKSPNQNRYTRLIALSSIQIFITLPVSLVSLYISAHVETVHPWISWEDTHADYSFVGQVPSFMWQADPITVVNLELIRWMVVVAAFVFFAFFGFAEEARKHYRMAYSFASSSLRLPDLRSKSSRASGGSSANASSPPYTPSSSFGNGFKKGMTTTFSSFKNPFSALGSHSSSCKSETTTTATIAERKDSFLVSEYRLTSNTSIFEGVDNPSSLSSKALEISPGDDDDSPQPAPAPAPVITSRNATEALAAVSNFPRPPPPIARVSVRSLPPGLYPQFPHSPTASDLYLDPSDAV